MRTSTRVLIAILALAVVASAALASVLGYRYLDARGVEASRDESLNAAKSYAATMFGYDPGNVADHVKRSQEIVIGDAKTQYDKIIANPVEGKSFDYVTGVKEQQIVSQALVQDAGVVTNTRDTSTVLIFMNLSVSRNGKEAVRVDPARVTFGMVRQDGQWKVQNIELITDDSFRSRIGETSTPPSGAVPLPSPSESGTGAPSTPASSVPAAPAGSEVPTATP